MLGGIQQKYAHFQQPIDLVITGLQIWKGPKIEYMCGKATGNVHVVHIVSHINEYALTGFHGTMDASGCVYSIGFYLQKY